MAFDGCLVPEQVAGGTCRTPAGVYLPGALAERKRDHTVGEFILYLRHKPLNHAVGSRVLATLHHNGAESCGICRADTPHSLIRVYGVAAYGGVRGAEPAVIAVVAAAVCYLH